MCVVVEERGRDTREREGGGGDTREREGGGHQRESERSGVSVERGKEHTLYVFPAPTVLSPSGHGFFGIDPGQQHGQGISVFFTPIPAAAGCTAVQAHTSSER